LLSGDEELDHLLNACLKEEEKEQADEAEQKLADIEEDVVQ
jgi:hypothetical protein